MHKGKGRLCRINFLSFFPSFFLGKKNLLEIQARMTKSILGLWDDIIYDMTLDKWFADIS